MKNPFRGLASYTKDDRDVLFGREDDLTLITARLFTRRTTLLFSGSGAGKTSFLNAKVAPELEDRYFIVYHNSWASTAPLEAVKQSITTAWQGSWWSRSEGQAPASRTLVETISSLLLKREDQDGNPVEANGTVLIMDQFEEVFQHHRETSGFTEFIRELAELILRSEPEVRVVFSMREEFLGELSVFDNKIPDLFANYYRLKSPTRRQAIEIIAETARSAGIRASASLGTLVDDLLAAAPPGSRVLTQRSREFVAPPLLQIVCQRLWDANPPTADSGFPASYKPGGASEALSRYCDEHLDILSESAQLIVSEALGFLMTRQGAKMAYELHSLAEHMKRKPGRIAGALDKLASPAVRILRRSRTPGGETWYELYHDMYASFLSNWNERYRRRRRSLAKRGLVVIAAVAAVVVWHFTGRATSLEQKIEARFTLSTAREQVSADAQLAILLTLAALRDSQGTVEVGTAEQILTAGIRTPVGTAVAETSAEMSGVEQATSPDKSLVVTGDQSGSLVWAEGGTSTTIKVANAGISALAFNQQGTVLLAGTDNGSTLWINARTRSVTAICPGAAGESSQVGFDSSYMAVTASGDGRVRRRWKRSTLLPVAALSSGPVHTVAYSPKQEPALIAAGAADAHVYLLKGDDLAVLGDWENKPVKSGSIEELVWRSDATQIAAVSDDGLLNLWNPGNGRNIASVNHNRSLWSVSWSPDRRSIAVAASDGGIYVLPLPLPETMPEPVARHGTGASVVRFSPSGEFLASSDWSGKILFTPLKRTEKGLKAPAVKISGAIADLEFGPPQLLALAPAKGTAEVYDYATGTQTATRAGSVTAVDFTPDGKFLATGGKDGVVRIWDIAAGRELLRFAEHSGTITDVHFSPDGKRLVSSGADGFVRVWATSMDDLVSLAKQYLTRELTDAQCKAFLKRDTCGPYANLRAN